MTPSASRITLVALCVLSHACSGEPADRVVDHRDYQGPNFVVLEPVLLEESDQYHLGNPSSLVVDTLDGSFLVSDHYSRRMFRFGRDGSVVRTYGRPGSGPGEFQSIGPAFVLNDSVVVGADMGRRQLSRFVSGTGEHAGLTPYPGSAGLTTAVVNGVALIPSVDLDSMKAMVVWDPAGGSLRHVIDLPSAYRRSLRGSGVFMGMFGLGTVAAWPDTMLFGMGGTNEVYVATWDGELIDTVDLPNVRRRGVPHDAQERIDDVANASTTFNERMEMLSLLHGLYVMSDGATVFIHHDIEVVGEPPMVEFLATIHASVLSRDRRTACVDGPIEFANEMRVVHTVARDTLYLLDRTLNEAEDAMMTWIRRYGIDTRVRLAAGRLVRGDRSRPSLLARRLLGYAVALAATIQLANCHDAETISADWIMVGGETLGELVHDRDLAVVLVMDPAQCFSCANLLAVWLDWRREHPGEFDLVLSRQPKPWERLRLAPLPISGFLSQPALDMSSTPMELVFSGGLEVYRSTGLQGVAVSPLLGMLREVSLREALVQLGVADIPYVNQSSQNRNDNGNRD